MFWTDVCLPVYNPLLACRSTTSASLSAGAHGLSENSPPSSTTSCMDHRTRPSRQERQEHNLSVGSSTTSCMDRSNGRIPTELAPIGKNGKNTGAGYWIPSNDLDRPDLWRSDGKQIILLRPCPTTHSVCISRVLPRAWAFSFITVYLKLPKILPARMTH